MTADLDIRANRHATCPYLLGIDDAHCITGCREEPRCITEQPRRGWQLRDSAGLFIPQSTGQAKAIAQQQWDAYQARHNKQ